MVDSIVKIKWGVGEVSHHQGVTTGPFKDPDIHRARTPRPWTHVTENINNQSVLAQEIPTAPKGSTRDGHNYIKRGLSSF